MTGGRGADVFEFRRLDGDTITDFNKSQRDKIDLSRVGEITGYGDLVANHLIDTPGKGSFAISLGGDNSLLVKGCDFDDVSASMFIF